MFSIWLCLCAASCPLHAQELPIRLQHSADRICDCPFRPTLSGPETMLPKTAFQERWRGVTERNILPIRKALFGPSRTQRKIPIDWQIRLGNSGPDNWSPFPDRALDARVIRYPMPRSAAWKSPVKPDNGPSIRKFR